MAATDLSTGVAALVVVSAADDWPNAGFAARVAEHMHYTLLPLLSAIDHALASLPALASR